MELMEEHKMENKKTGRISAIDWIKVIACLGVVCLHTIDRETAPLNNWLYYAAGWSIPLFMMSTGFFLFNREEPLTQTYITNKILRIFRFCFLWVCVVTGLNIGMMLIEVGWDFRSVLSMLAGIPSDTILSMIQLGSVGVLWYCGGLVLLYLFAYVFYRRKMRKWRVWMACFVCGGGLQLVSFLLHEPVHSLFCRPFRIWTWLQYGMLGAMMPQITDAVAKRLPLAGHVLLALAVYPVLVSYQAFAGTELIDNGCVECFYDSVSMILIVTVVFSLALRLSQRAVKKEKTIASGIAMLSVGVFPVHGWIYEQILRVDLPALPLNYSQICVLHFVVTVGISFVVMAIVSRTHLKEYLLKI